MVSAFSLRRQKESRWLPSEGTISEGHLLRKTLIPDLGAVSLRTVTLGRMAPLGDREAEKGTVNKRMSIVFHLGRTQCLGAHTVLHPTVVWT